MPHEEQAQSRREEEGIVPLFFDSIEETRRALGEVERAQRERAKAAGEGENAPAKGPREELLALKEDLLTAYLLNLVLYKAAEEGGEGEEPLLREQTRDALVRLGVYLEMVAKTEKRIPAEEEERSSGEEEAAGEGRRPVPERIMKNEGRRAKGRGAARRNPRARKRENYAKIMRPRNKKE